MSEYHFTTIAPEHRGLRRILTSGCRRANTPAHALAGKQALAATSLLLQSSPVGAQFSDERFLVDHGGADGADAFVWEAGARELAGLAPVAHPAQWNTHLSAPLPIPGPHEVPEPDLRPCPAYHAGKDRCIMAGHRRNEAMLALGPSVLLAMPTVPKSQAKELKISRGTWNMVGAALRKQIPTLIVWSPAPETVPFRLFWANDLAHTLVYENWWGKEVHARELAAGNPLAEKSIDLTTLYNIPPF